MKPAPRQSVRCLASLFILLVCAGNTPVWAETVMGGVLVSNGDAQKVEILAPSATYKSDLFLFNGSEPVLLASGHDVGKVVELGVFPAGTVMRIGIKVYDKNVTFMMGAGTENPDNLPHATTTVQSDGSVVVGFEDMLRGGDHDYNDFMFRFSGSIQKRPPVFTTLPTATPQTVDSHNPVQFAGLATDPDGLPLSYTWKFGDGSEATGTTATHVFSQPGTYTVIMIADDGQGGVTSATVVVTVLSDPANQPPSIISGPQVDALPVVLNTPVNFMVSGSDPENDPLVFTWDFGDGTSGTGPTVSHTYTQSGNYTVAVTADDGNNGKATGNMVVLVAKDFTISRMLVTLNFAKKGRDSISLQGKLPLAGTPANLTMRVEIAGLSQELTLSSRGIAKTRTAAAKLTAIKKVKDSLQFTFQMKQGSFAEALAPLGLENTTIKARSVNIPVTLSVGSTIFWHQQPQKYTAVKNKTGKTK